MNLVTDVTNTVFKGKSVSKEDRRLIGTASSEVLKQDYLQAAETWGSAETGSAGDVTITAMAVNGDERCRELSVKGYKKKKFARYHRCQCLPRQ
jgi:surface antigen